MQVEVFSDVVCPWCYIGKRRFEEALETFPHAGDVTVTYRSFQLDPSTPVGSPLRQTEALAQKYGIPEAKAVQMNERVTDVAATVGLDFHIDKAYPANTFDAHRLLHFAADRGRQAELKERLLAAYFTEGVRVDDREELVRLAEEVGLDAHDARTALSGNDYADAVEADLELARAFGASGVPFFVFDRKFGVSGAQETAVFSDVLERAWSDAQPLTMAGDSNADGCADGACAV